MFKKRTVITFEKLERYFYRLPSSEPLNELCAGCGCVVTWLTPNQVVLLTGVSLRELFRRIEADTLHFNESGPGVMRICARSVGL